MELSALWRPTLTWSIAGWLAGSVPTILHAQTSGWPQSLQTCRTTTAAVLRGQTDMATEALTPPHADPRVRRHIHDLMQRLSDNAAAMTHHLPPRLEREFAAQSIGSVPVSIELWSFGEQEAYLVGCAIRPMEGSARISIQAYPTVSDIISHLQQALSGDEADPQDNELRSDPADQAQ